jgi:hypothetical protein
MRAVPYAFSAVGIRHAAERGKHPEKHTPAAAMKMTMILRLPEILDLTAI